MWRAAGIGTANRFTYQSLPVSIVACRLPQQHVSIVTWYKRLLSIAHAPATRRYAYLLETKPSAAEPKDKVQIKVRPEAD